MQQPLTLHEKSIVLDFLDDLTQLLSASQRCVLVNSKHHIPFKVLHYVFTNIMQYSPTLSVKIVPLIFFKRPHSNSSEQLVGLKRGRIESQSYVCDLETSTSDHIHPSTLVPVSNTLISQMGTGGGLFFQTH